MVIHTITMFEHHNSAGSLLIAITRLIVGILEFGLCDLLSIYPKLIQIVFIWWYISPISLKLISNVFFVSAFHIPLLHIPQSNHLESLYDIKKGSQGWQKTNDWCIIKPMLHTCISSWLMLDFNLICEMASLNCKMINEVQNTKVTKAIRPLQDTNIIELLISKRHTSLQCETGR